MSAAARADAPCTSMVRSRKPAAPKRLSTPVPMAAASRCPRWPVARVTPSARARTATAPISARRGDRPECSRAGLAVRRAVLADAARAAFGGALAGDFALTREPPRTAPGIRVLRDPQHQTVEIHALLRRLLGDERSGRHAGLGVHLQEDKNIVNIVVTKVGPGH